MCLQDIYLKETLHTDNNEKCQLKQNKGLPVYLDRSGDVLNPHNKNVNNRSFYIYSFQFFFTLNDAKRIPVLSIFERLKQKHVF